MHAVLENGALPRGHAPRSNSPGRRDRERTWNAEPRTKNKEPNLNTNREVRTEKFERLVFYSFTPTGQVTPVPPSPQ